MRDRAHSGELASEVRGLILVRALVAAALGLLLAWAHRNGSLGVPPGPLFGVLAGTWGLTLLYWMGLRFGVSFGTLLGGQIVLDLVAETLLVAATGGTSSPLVILYFVTILTAGLYLERRGPFLAAAGAAAAFAAAAWVGGDGARALPAARWGYEVAVHGGAFVLLAVLAAVVAIRSRRSRERLESAEQELERVTVRTERVLENMPIGVITAFDDGEVARANRAARELLGLEGEEELEGRSLAAVLAAFSPSLVDDLGSILATRKWATRGEVVVEEGGRERPLGISMAPLLDRDGSLEGVIVTLSDLREIRRMEREMRRAEQLAALGELAAGVAHEIRNPLASISGAVQVLQSEGEAEGEEAELMDLIVRESDRLNRIIDGVLDYSRDHSGTRSCHDLQATVREVVRMVLHDRALSLGKTVLVEFPSDQDFRAEVEEGGMKQVFYNLARNALEAMDMGGILRITGETADGRVHISFRDTGVGIPPHELDHIFKPFHTSKPGGTGMGLSIASRIVEGNGGTIRARSTPGMGTAVTVELPAAPAGGSSPDAGQPKRGQEITGVLHAGARS